jgi:flagellar basal-body rod modification protein FlgD
MKGLGEDAFMLLLLAQLKNQDPLKPMEDKDFIAQLAQFNSLSQLTQMNDTLNGLMTAQTLAQGSALIGKTVSGLSSDGGAVTGLVSGLHMLDSRVILDVNGQSVPLESVHSVQGEFAEG